MSTTWVLIAQGSAARLVEVSKNGQEIALVEEFFHPETAEKGTSVYSDRPGRSYESAGHARHAMAWPTPLDEHERMMFAKELADFLAKAFAQNRFSQVIIVSAKELLGEIRRAVSRPVSKVITHQLNKDLLSQRLSDKELVEIIGSDLGLLHW